MSQNIWMSLPRYVQMSVPRKLDSPLMGSWSVNQHHGVLALKYHGLREFGSCRTLRDWSILFIWQMRTLWPREVKWFAKGHIARRTPSVSFIKVSVVSVSAIRELVTPSSLPSPTHPTLPQGAGGLCSLVLSSWGYTHVLGSIAELPGVVWLLLTGSLISPSHWPGHIAISSFLWINFFLLRAYCVQCRCWEWGEAEREMVRGLKVQRRETWSPLRACFRKNLTLNKVSKDPKDFL